MRLEGAEGGPGTGPCRWTTTAATIIRMPMPIVITDERRRDARRGIVAGEKPGDRAEGRHQDRRDRPAAVMAAVTDHERRGAGRDRQADGARGQRSQEQVAQRACLPARPERVAQGGEGADDVASKVPQRGEERAELGQQAHHVAGPERVAGGGEDQRDHRLETDRQPRDRARGIVTTAMVTALTTPTPLVPCRGTAERSSRMVPTRRILGLRPPATRILAALDRSCGPTRIRIQTTRPRTASPVRCFPPDRGW